MKKCALSALSCISFETDSDNCLTTKKFFFLISTQIFYCNLSQPIRSQLFFSQQLPLAAQQEFLRSGLTTEEVMRDWHIFLNCIYFQCRSAFTNPPVEIVKQRSQPQHEKPATLNTSSSISHQKTEQNRNIDHPKGTTY
jgi:hypothetical protein